MNYRELVEETFLKKYHERPLIIRSPGRINIIGEHTDYNDGFVLPAAIDRALFFAFSPRSDNAIIVDALNVNEHYEGSINELAPYGSWQRYILGVLNQLQRREYAIKGFQCVFGGDIPIGAGISSSAALGVGVAYGLNILFQLNIEPLELAKLAQKAEHEYAGVLCGIMDQYTNIFGERGTALKIDCRFLTHEVYPVDHRVTIVLLNTGITHRLASSKYNQRRMECQRGVTILKQWYPALTHLRDVTEDMLLLHRDAFDATTFKRCLYVIQENERVNRACAALRRNDLITLGSLLYDSHNGLKNEYEVSCPELDYLVELAQTSEGVYGARLMGGGFGGCTINLVDSKYVEDFCSKTMFQFENKFGRSLVSYSTTTCNGTHVEQ
ncbi:MAG: galactokinase [Bacteroidetes bacterium]|nr:galactokinase [Bacteroidota bacterium]